MKTKGKTAGHHVDMILDGSVLTASCEVMNTGIGMYIWWDYDYNALKQRLALVPPKPKLLDKATLTWRCCGVVGT